MILFVVTYSYEYEGGAVCGVYADEELAWKRAKEVKDLYPSSDVEVNEVYLNTGTIIDI